MKNTNSLVWLFVPLMESMRYIQSKTIFTDEDIVMRNAAAKVLYSKFMMKDNLIGSFLGIMMEENFKVHGMT